MSGKGLFLTAGLAAILTLGAGCGPDPVNREESGTLESSDDVHPADQSNYDPYEFQAKEGWNIVIRMTSTEFQPFLQLRMKDQGDDGMVQQAGEAGTTSLNHVAHQTGTYVVWANSNQPGETGAYTLLIGANP